MIEATYPWAIRGPFYFQEKRVLIGDKNRQVDQSAVPFRPSLKHDFREGGYAELRVALIQTNAISTDPYTYEYQNTVQFESHVLEGDQSHQPWVGVTLKVRALKKTYLDTIVDNTVTSTELVSEENVYYDYQFSTANYNPDPSDPNWTSPNYYVLPYTSMPDGPTYTSVKADLHLTEGEYWDTIDGTITRQQLEPVPDAQSFSEVWSFYSITTDTYE